MRGQKERQRKNIFQAKNNLAMSSRLLFWCIVRAVDHKNMSLMLVYSRVLQ